MTDEQFIQSITSQCIGTHLSELHLSDNNLTCRATEFLFHQLQSGKLQMPQLRLLDLSHNDRLKSTGCMWVAECVRYLPSLETLDMNETGMDDFAYKQLSQVGNHLVSVDTSGNYHSSVI